MRSDVEIAEHVIAKGGDILLLSHDEIERALALRILTESGNKADDKAAAERWLKQVHRPPGFDPKLVTPRAPTKSNPAHYQRDGIEPIELIESCGLDFLLGNVVKYVSRAGQKPGESREADLAKASDYLHRARFGRWPWEADNG